MPTNRVVILLSPVFVGLAGWVVTLAAKYLPGHPHLDASQLDAVFIAGAVFAAAHVGQWVHGWQKQEARQSTPVEPPAPVAPVTPLESAAKPDPVAPVAPVPPPPAAA